MQMRLVALLFAALVIGGGALTAASDVLAQPDPTTERPGGCGRDKPDPTTS